jgi:hypothetical protein
MNQALDRVLSQPEDDYWEQGWYKLWNREVDSIETTYGTVTYVDSTTRPFGDDEYDDTKINYVVVKVGDRYFQKSFTTNSWDSSCDLGEVVEVEPYVAQQTFYVHKATGFETSPDSVADALLDSWGHPVDSSWGDESWLG